MSTPAGQVTKTLPALLLAVVVLAGCTEASAPPKLLTLLD